MEPTIIFEDDSIVVVDKPSGMIVYPDGRHDYPALSDWLAKKYKEFYFVHRIDRETSGVLLVAKTEKVREFLKAQFKNREVRKVYRAFVYGAFAEERGIIDKPIGSARGGKGPRSALMPHGAMREAVTVYRVLKCGSGPSTVLGTSSASYVEVFPKTGRTHQIRVHFAAVQHPIVCDRLYAPARPPLLGFSRLALHALSLSFKNADGKDTTFEAPLPADFIAAEKKLK